MIHPAPKPRRQKRVRVKARWEGFVAPKIERVHDAEYLKYLRSLPCAVCTSLAERQSSRTEAHHTKSRGAFGGDDGAVNLCTRHHKAWHLLGRKSFKTKYGVDLVALAKEMWGLWQKRGWAQ